MVTEQGLFASLIPVQERPPLTQFTHLHGFQRFLQLLPLRPVSGMAQQFLEVQGGLWVTTRGSWPSPSPGTGVQLPHSHRQWALAPTTHRLKEGCPRTSWVTAETAAAERMPS